jgi:hypothetical protein
MLIAGVAAALGKCQSLIDLSRRDHQLSGFHYQQGGQFTRPG